jgi:hypothetical protein
VLPGACTQPQAPSWCTPSHRGPYCTTGAYGCSGVVRPQGANTRDVYLTQGQWRELHDETVVFEGGQWLRNLSAPLDKLPCFVRVGTRLDAA